MIEFRRDELKSQLERNDNHLLMRNTTITHIPQLKPQMKKGVETTSLFAKSLDHTSYSCTFLLCLFVFF